MTKQNPHFRIFSATLLVLAMLTGVPVKSLKQEASPRVFDVAYETVTNKLWALPQIPTTYYRPRVTNTVPTNANAKG